MQADTIVSGVVAVAVMLPIFWTGIDFEVASASFSIDSDFDMKKVGPRSSVPFSEVVNMDGLARLTGKVAPELSSEPEALDFEFVGGLKKSRLRERAGLEDSEKTLVTLFAGGHSHAGERFEVLSHGAIGGILHALSEL